MTTFKAMRQVLGNGEATLSLQEDTSLTHLSIFTQQGPQDIAHVQRWCTEVALCSGAFYTSKRNVWKKRRLWWKCWSMHKILSFAYCGWLPRDGSPTNAAKIWHPVGPPSCGGSIITPSYDCCVARLMLWIKWKSSFWNLGWHPHLTRC